MSIRIYYDINDAQKNLSGLARHMDAMADPKTDIPALEQFKEYMLVRTDLMFATSARDDVRWKPLKDSTKRSRRQKGVGHSRPLDVTGGIRRSIRGHVILRVAGLATVISTNHPMARVHHDGAHIPAHEVKPTKAKVLAFRGKDGNTIFAAKVNIPAFDIPARPIVFITERDEKTGLRYIRENRLKVLRKAFPTARVVNA